MCLLKLNEPVRDSSSRRMAFHPHHWYHNCAFFTAAIWHHSLTRLSIADAKYILSGAGLESMRCPHSYWILTARQVVHFDAMSILKLARRQMIRPACHTTKSSSTGHQILAVIDQILGSSTLASRVYRDCSSSF